MGYKKAASQSVSKPTIAMSGTIEARKEFDKPAILKAIFFTINGPIRRRSKTTRRSSIRVHRDFPIAFRRLFPFPAPSLFPRAPFDRQPKDGMLEDRSLACYKEQPAYPEVILTH